MRNISFSITLQAFHDGTKDVTRRLGWKNLKPGDHLMAVEKAQGLKKGEHVVKIGEIVVVSSVWEQLNCIEYSNYRDDDTKTYGLNKATYQIRKETVREGFPAATPESFVKMFCKFNGCTPDTIVNRIVFVRLP